MATARSSTKQLILIQTRAFWLEVGVDSHASAPRGCLGVLDPAGNRVWLRAGLRRDQQKKILQLLGTRRGTREDVCAVVLEGDSSLG